MLYPTTGRVPKETTKIKTLPTTGASGHCKQEGLNEVPTELLPEDCDQIDTQLTAKICEIIAGTADISECVGVVVIEKHIYCVLVHKKSPVILFEQVRVSPRVLN
jgi:hypothetical protein